MEVLAVDGRPASELILDDSLPVATVSVEMRGASGETVQANVGDTEFGGRYSDLSLWALGGMFAILGSAVLLRRPDLSSARWFGLFTGSSAVALAVGPAAAGPQPQWALVLQIVSLVGLGAASLPFVVALVDEPRRSRVASISLVFGMAAVALLTGYTAAVVYAPELYEIVRPALLLYLSASLFGAVGLLAFNARWQQRSSQRQQSRIALWGVALGTLPLVGLTMIPLALANTWLVPDHITILAVGIVPAAFAYAILKYRWLGIRRLVHRGMVYGIATLLVVGFNIVVLTAALSFVSGPTGGSYPLYIVASLVAVGVVLVFPLRNAARWLVDRLVYGNVTSYESIMDAVRGNLLTSNRTQEILSEVSLRLVDELQLESVLLYLGNQPAHARLAVAVGPRAEETRTVVHPQLEERIVAAPRRELSDLRWQAESLLLANLTVPGRDVGYMLLGPKVDGEVFVEEEKHQVATIAPLLALTVDQSMLSDELRQLNQRMVRAQETERARVAVDIHDGPLQKAILLSGGVELVAHEEKELARELVAELREIGSRLRPSILDDLGLAASMDWLLDAGHQSGRI